MSYLPSTSARRSMSFLRSTSALVPFVALAIVAAACASGGDPEVVAQTTVPSTTTTTAPPVYPLTGQAATDPTNIFRSAMVAKIDNAEAARPQVGLNQADIVYEERVEGITRFAAVFHSRDSDPVGPVRSARTSDLDLLASLNKPFLVYSGGNGYVEGALSDADVTKTGHNEAFDQYVRDPERRGPHNLFTSVSVLYALFADQSDGPPPALFTYRADGEALVATALPAPGATIDYGNGLDVDFVWDETRQGWVRFQRGELHVDAAGLPIAPQNVVIIYTDYVASPADPRSPEAVTTGEGEATILTAGAVIQGRWQRVSPEAPWVLTDRAGNPINLTPGQTFVALPEPGRSEILNEERAAELRALIPLPGTEVPPE